LKNENIDGTDPVARPDFYETEDGRKHTRNPDATAKEQFGYLVEDFKNGNATLSDILDFLVANF
jgi:hypothetical protein